jgi:hypothetical protein
MTEPTTGSGFRRIDLFVAVVSLAIVIPACNSGVDRVREAAARSQSSNNLKMMCIGMQSIASRNQGLLPPSAGVFDSPPRGRVDSTIFFHMLPDIEQDNVYNAHWREPSNVPATTTIKTFCAPLDPSNPGVNTNLTSYASNAAVFGLKDGGSTRFPAAFNEKGTANSILFMERFAVASGTRHTWYGRDDLENYLYPPAAGAPAITNARDAAKIPAPQFGVAPDAARNDTAHAFSSNVLLVAMADGSIRNITTAVSQGNPSAWSWACTFSQGPPPAGW